MHVQQQIISEGPLHGPNGSAVLMARVRKAEQRLSKPGGVDVPLAAPVSQASMAATLTMQAMGQGPERRPRPETLALAARGDPIAIFVTQNGIDYSAETALRSLPINQQCKVLNEGPLRGTNASRVLMA